MKPDRVDHGSASLAELNECMVPTAQAAKTAAVMSIFKHCLHFIAVTHKQIK